MPEILHSSELAVVGEFVCRPDDAAWSKVNVIGDDVHFVYPRISVVIAQLGHPTVLATPNHVMLYAEHQRYRRHLASPAGDRCTYLQLPPRSAQEVLELIPGGRLPAPALPLAASVYLLAHALLEHLRSAPRGDDPLEIDSAVTLLLQLSLRGASSRSRPAARSRRRRHALAEEAKLMLAETYTQRLTLAEVAHALHVSRWHLARVFHEQTGFTVHGYRQQLRLRRALELLAEGGGLTDVALSLGFSSHSHLTTAFTRVFRQPPSRIRQAELRTIVKAARLPSS